MSQAVQNDAGYPSLIEIVNSWRSLINDPAGEIVQTPLINQATGEVITVSVSDVTDPEQGQIITGEVTICATILAKAVRTVVRKALNISSQQLLFDNLLFSNLPIMNSPTYGEGAADQTVQVQLGPTGFFDGVMLWPNYQLPSTVRSIIKVTERLTNSQNNFHHLTQAQNGLAAVMQSAYSNTSWEVRGNILCMNGCIQPTDIIIRGWMDVPTKAFSQSVDYTQTYVPLKDCTDAVAQYCVHFYNVMQGSGDESYAAVIAESKAAAQEAVDDILLPQIRAMQGKAYHREPYNGDGHNSGL